MTAALSRLGNFTSFNATGADLLTLDAALRALHAYGLQVGVEPATRAVVGVRNIVAELRAFATDFASFSHGYLVPPNIEKRKSNSLC